MYQNFYNVANALLLAGYDKEAEACRDYVIANGGIASVAWRNSATREEIRK